MLNPLGDRILVRPEANPTETASGLHLVEHRKPEMMGEVVKVAERIAGECPECGHTLYRTPQVEVGDSIVFSWTAGQEIYVDDERFFLMRESDVLAVLEGVE